MGTFKKGLVLGGLLGAGLMWLSTTKKGREVKDQMLDHAADVYLKVKEKAVASGALKELGKNQYVVMVKEYVDKYAIENGLAENVKNMITKIVSSQWRNLQEELKNKE